MPIEQQQSGSVEPETQVFAKITTEEPTVPATTPATPAAQAPARPPKSLTRRIARRILGPTLMTKK
ncbi:hypothetical protein [Lentzea sp. NPDC004782]|uniref:hypothetical protein n=1 Tax=Lentzea sp. NPDC004782 TaxID=3154458 RepID=UPI0033BEC190